MYYILLGVFGFVLFFLFDYFTLTNKGLLKRAMGVAGLAVFIYSAIMTTVVSQQLLLPVIIRITSGILCCAFFFLLIYSLFLELPFTATYGRTEHSTALVDTGTYGLCRHPGVLWFGLVFLFYFLTTGALLIIPGGIVWFGIDVLHVWLQEKMFFTKMFPGYREYQRTTPMLIPTGYSLKRCLSTINVMGGFQNDKS